jgi:hypothetical protein
MFGLYLVWAVRSQARYLRGQNRLAEQIEAIEKLEAIPDAGAPQNSTLVDS